ncbi:hypothetical protein HDU67_005196 [Dinochytrium kinnereticum]|nr:hypothetical protein HDU67_005196 [Dinochytrium kinnereticum]
MTLFTRDPFFSDFFNQPTHNDPFFGNFDRYVNSRISSAFRDVNRALDQQAEQGGPQQQVSAAGDGSGQQVAHRPSNSLWARSFSRAVRLDVSETDKAYLIHADLPGLNKEDISITVKDDILTISGERKSNNEIKDEHRHVIERSYGKFSRSIQLPQNADSDKVAAKLQDGVLELSVDKREVPAIEGPKKIAIQ